MNVLVTGAAGLIGMAVRETLAAAGHAVTAIDVTTFGRDDPGITTLGLDDDAAIDALVKDRGIDSIVHCSAISGPMLFKGQPMAFVDVNIVATARLLDLARRHKMKRFVFCSSISVYGSVGPGVISETTPLKPTSVYGATKVACEALIEAFAAEYGVDGVSLRIPRVYGPYRRANCHLKNIIRDAAAGNTTAIPCVPDFAYHYIYVEDVAEAIRAVLEAPSLPARAYNVVTGVAQTMPEIAAIAREAISESRIDLMPGADDVSDAQEAFEGERIARDLGWRARFDLTSGLVAYRDAIQSGRSA